MIRFIYNLLFPVGLLLFLPGYLLKMRRRGNYRQNFGQRFARYNPDVRTRLAAGSRTWIHAVSVGEVAVALKLAAQLRQLDPSFRCVLTTTTTTGYAVATEAAAEWMEVLYNPLDFLPLVRRAFAVIRPERIVLVEAEVWPNLAAEAQSRRIPIALVNARLSPRSERRFRRFRPFVAPTFRCLDLVCVQEQEDVARWESLGVVPERIQHVGSIKFDPSENLAPAALPEEARTRLGGARHTPLLLGGSTHPGEEEILAHALLALRTEFPALRLMIAPRHVERAPEIASSLEEMGLTVARRSHPSSGVADCMLLDTTGELRSWYLHATVVFMGKSLMAHGGQNPVEPILAGKPVIFGPHMENFAALARSLLLHGAAIQVETAEALQQKVAELLRDEWARAALVENAQRVLAQHRGATARTAALLMKLAPSAEASS